MPRGLVLVIEDDAWVSDLLDNAVREAGYEVKVCATADQGLATAIEAQPDCIVCDIDLPDQDGYWVARNVRTHPSRVSVTPFLFLSGLDDEESRLEGFHVGADVYMTKPFRVDEVVAQVHALVQMATRLRARRDSMLSIPAPASESAIAGDLAQMSIATVLTVIEMERRSGSFEVTSKKRKAQLSIAQGAVTRGLVGGTPVSGLTALRTMLAWKTGRFSFKPGPAVEAPHSRKSLGAMLIEALRLEDEAARVELELPPGLSPVSERSPSERPSSVTVGGPPSAPSDFAPPSSRAPRGNEPSASFEADLSDWEIPSGLTPRAPDVRRGPPPPPVRSPSTRAIPPPPPMIEPPRGAPPRPAAPPPRPPPPRPPPPKKD